MPDRNYAHTATDQPAAFRDRFNAAYHPSGLPGGTEAATLRTFDATVTLAKRRARMVEADADKDTDATPDKR